MSGAYSLRKSRSKSNADCLQIAQNSFRPGFTLCHSRLAHNGGRCPLSHLALNFVRE